VLKINGDFGNMLKKTAYLFQNGGVLQPFCQMASFEGIIENAWF
jgi:hypothetical protein